MTFFTWVGIVTVAAVGIFLAWLLFWGLIPMARRAWLQSGLICADLQRKRSARGDPLSFWLRLRQRHWWFCEEIFASYSIITVDGISYPYDPKREE